MLSSRLSVTLTYYKYYLKRYFKSALITLINSFVKNKIQGITLPGFIFFLFSQIILVSGYCVSISAQELTAVSPSTVAEEQDYAFASGLYRDSLFQLAGQQFETFAKKYPNSIKRQDAAFLSIECFFQSSQFQKAVAKYNEFILDYPNSRYMPEAYLKLGQSHLNQKKNNEAIVAFKNVLDKFAESETAGEAAYWAGEAYLRNDEVQNAVKYYTLAYENYPKNRLKDYALYSIAWTLQKQSKYEKAVEWYDKLITECPKSSLTPGAHVRIGECFYYAKDYHNAIDVLTKLHAEIHDNEELGNSDYLLAEAYYKLGELNEAQTRYEKFLIDYPNHTFADEVTYDLAWIYYNQKNFTKAIQTFNKLTSRNNELGHAALYRRGTAERFAGQKETALKTFSEVVQREPHGQWSDNALFDAGMIYFEETNASKAKLYFQQMTREFPASDVMPDGCKMLGECLFIEGSLKEAEFWFDKTVTMPTVSFDVKVEASFQSALCSYKLKLYKEASAKFAAFVAQYQKHPKMGEAKFYQAEAEYKLGNYNIAIRLYSEALENVSTAKKEEVLYGTAWSFYKQENFQQAIESFEHLLVDYPKGKFAFDARLRLGDVYFFQKNYSKAIGSYRMVIRMYPDSTSIDYAYFQIGQSYLKEGDNSEAIKAFNGLISAMPRSKLADDAQFAVGWVNFQRKDYAEAIKEFNKLIITYPNSELAPRAYYSLGDSYYNLKQYVAAEKSYREVLKQFPKSSNVADATTGIQYCMIALGKDAEAIEVLDDFMKENPNSPAGEELQLKKGELLFNQKKYIEAAKVYKGFVEKYPNSKLLAHAQYSLAKCYRAQNSLDEAALTFEQVANVSNASDKVIGESLFEAAEIYNAQHKHEKAISALQNLQGKVKDREIIAEAKIRTGETFQLWGKNAEANAQFDQVINEFMDFQIADEARMDKAKMYFALHEFDQSKTFAEKVASSRKDELGAEAQYIVGASLAGKKDWTNVITALLRVKYVFPSYDRWVGRAYLGLGDAYEQMKDLRKARESYRAALKLNTDKSVIEEAQRRLKRMEKQ